MRLAFSSVMFADLPIEDVCARAAKLGFEAIDIWGPLANCKHLADVVARLGMDGLKELLAKHQLALAALPLQRSGVRGEAVSHAGASPAGRIGRFTTESCVREEAARPNPKARRESTE